MGFYRTYKGSSVKNHTDVLIFHMRICAGAPQILLMADQKPHSRISHRPRRAKRSGMGSPMKYKLIMGIGALALAGALLCGIFLLGREDGGGVQPLPLSGIPLETRETSASLSQGASGDNAQDAKAQPGERLTGSSDPDGSQAPDGQPADDSREPSPLADPGPSPAAGTPQEGNGPADPLSSPAPDASQDEPGAAAPLPSQEDAGEYADLAIAHVTRYVNVRSAPDTESEIVGKIYDGAVAHILAAAGPEQDWFQIVSGNVQGYIKSEFFLYGEAAAEVIDDYVTRYATVIADRLNVRSEPDLASGRIGYIDNGERVKLLEDQGDWLKVQYTDTQTGYVAAPYVTLEEEFVYAKTLEEEAKELAEQKALEERQHASEAQTAENTAVTVTPPDTDYTTNGELRQSIVDYAMQFLGNKYVHGGQSLTTGTDCSGFTSLIYKEFGYSISRTPAGQLSSAGRGVDYSQIQIGDIICYGSGGKCTHVALYIGDGQIIHAANSRKGVIIGEADYDTILGVRNVID